MFKVKLCEIFEINLPAILRINFAIKIPITNTMAAKRILGNNFIKASNQRLSLLCIKSETLVTSIFLKLIRIRKEHFLPNLEKMFEMIKKML